MLFSLSSLWQPNFFMTNFGLIVSEALTSSNLYRLFTYWLVHTSAIQLLSILFWTLVLGAIIEKAIIKKHTIILIVLSIVAGGIMFLIYSQSTQTQHIFYLVGGSMIVMGYAGAATTIIISTWKSAPIFPKLLAILAIIGFLLGSQFDTKGIAYITCYTLGLIYSYFVMTNRKKIWITDSNEIKNN